MQRQDFTLYIYNKYIYIHIIYIYNKIIYISIIYIINL